ncbi:MAG: hypothetical protein CVU09_15875 [Bacteroidetes bacterium HGW-Bacteroidetes-4]|jgi:hypothetical protein|nr:MAG: hypothetical protein CVU09_15875 [Bacteroidetes bacterium HGW-Bacteroidetes-4]
MENGQNKILAEQLKSANKELILDTIKSLRHDGNDEVLEILTQIYLNQTNNEISQAIYRFFCDLKNQPSAETVIRLIKNPEYHQAKKMLVSSCWQSRLNYIVYLETFIAMVFSEPFELAFEAFTVVENMEARVSEQRKKELLAFVDANMDNCIDDNLVLADDLKGIIQLYPE